MSHPSRTHAHRKQHPASIEPSPRDAPALRAAARNAPNPSSQAKCAWLLPHLNGQRSPPLPIASSPSPPRPRPHRDQDGGDPTRTSQAHPSTRGKGRMRERRNASSEANPPLRLRQHATSSSTPLGREPLHPLRALMGTRADRDSVLAQPRWRRSRLPQRPCWSHPPPVGSERRAAAEDRDHGGESQA
jgi:hypothetical protein